MFLIDVEVSTKQIVYTYQLWPVSIIVNIYLKIFFLNLVILCINGLLNVEILLYQRRQVFLGHVQGLIRNRKCLQSSRVRL